MVMASVTERFAQRAPLPVMARLILQQVLGQDWVNALFEQYRQSQYTSGIHHGPLR